MFSFHRQYKDIWAKLEYKINDWWSYISGVEYLILIEQYDEALAQLKLHFETVDTAETNDFEILSTLRQLRLYSEFCNDSGLNKVMKFLEKQVPKDKE